MPFKKGHKGFRTRDSYEKAAIKIKNNPNSAKTRFKKGSSGFTGKHTEETRQKIKEARARQGGNVWNKGKSGYKSKPASEERKNKISEAQRAEKNHNWKGGKPKCVCGKELQHHQRGKKCRKCWAETKRGEAHWNWTGGKSHEPYPHYFRESLKKKIRERDSYTCQNCLIEANSVHHIDYNKDNCTENNLITLCKSCNTKANYGREKWETYYKEKICQIQIKSATCSIYLS